MKTLSLTKKERWIYIIIAAVCMAATFPGRTQGLGMVTEFILLDLQIDRIIYGYFNLAATLIGALFCIPIGSMLDKYGVRRVLLWIMIPLSIAVLCMSMTNSPIFFFIALVFTRGFGQSALSVASMSLISKYFPKERLGVAMGIFSVIMTVLMMLSFALMGYALRNVAPVIYVELGNLMMSFTNWRVAWASVGLIILFICVPLLFLIRKSAVMLNNDVLQTDEGKTSIPFSLAIKTSIFWIFALSISFFGLVNSGVALFNENILAERGFDREMYHLLMIIPWPFALATNLGVGYLARKVKVSYLLFGSLLLMGLLKVIFPFIQTAPQIIAYTIALGFSAGALTVLFFIVWADLFGRKEVGKIQGLAQMMSVVASAVGPIFFAYSYSWTNSYSPAFFISGGLTLTFAVLALIVRIPQR